MTATPRCVDAPPVEICPNPIFIIGSPRSGTTGLAAALQLHTQLWTWDESQILWDLFGDGVLDKNYGRASRPDGSWLMKQNIERAVFREFLGLGLNALFTSRSNGRRWIDHTPIYTLIASEIADLFPGAVFIHLVRDGRKVVHSMMHFAEIIETSEPWAHDFRTACMTWTRYVETAAAFVRLHERRALTVIQDELVNDPTLLSHVFDFIGVPHEDTPIEFFGSGRYNSSFASSSMGTPWEAWTADERAMFAEESGKTLVEAGFASADELAVAPLTR